MKPHREITVFRRGFSYAKKRRVNTTAFLLCFNFKLFHQSFEGILSVKAGVGQISLLPIPFGETSVIIHSAVRSFLIDKAAFVCYNLNKSDY